ncbi:lipopolysaccharide heptosyltransferase I [Isoalcanivorax beigongshangi]|uniref:Lipopolysaccharide heptosyltransferase 1 n=1 Tax=Isoalcanivorax beigongshangi TaxID=3238810 RepID=A0ABV4AE67_9GAMM
MSRVLLVKTSSMGDVIHTLPALTDALQADPGLRIDWVVESAFADLPARHPAVAEVIPCALRRWRKHPIQARRSGEWAAFRARLHGDYDAVIDAQGLIKSAFVTARTGHPRFGFDRHSAREPLSAWVLDRPLAVARGQHAVLRQRQLFAQALGYPLPDSAPDYGLPRSQPPRPLSQPGQLVFCHGTTWTTKHYPEPFWRALAERASAEGHQLFLPWGNEVEQARAARIAAGLPRVEVLPAMSLTALTDAFLGWDAFIAVDTGLAHLAAACGLAGIGLYGPTDPALTGVLGARAVSMAADFPCAPCVQERCQYRGNQGAGVEPPCFSRLDPHTVWTRLQEVAQ